VLKGVAAVISIRAEEKNLELLIDEGPDSAIFGRDSLRLSQILNNLANNAVKFTETGEIEIKIRAERQIPSQARLMIRWCCTLR